MAEGGGPNLEGLGRAVREARGRLSLTQTDLAGRLGWVQERVSLIETGKYGMPSLPALVRLSDALEIRLASLVEAAGYDGIRPHGEGEPPGPPNAALQYTLQHLLSIEASSLRGAMEAASDLLAQVMGADKVDAFLYEAETETLVAMGTSNTAMGRQQHRLGLNRTPIANQGREVQAFLAGKPFYTGRADLDPESGIGTVQGLGVRSMLAVPLIVDTHVRGVMLAVSSHPDRFSPEEQEFFYAATRWVGMVAKRAELTESLTRAAAEEARRLAAEELVSLLAHDLGNALPPIKGHLQLLQRRFVREARDRDLHDVDAIARSMEKLQRMVSELLDIARLDQGVFSIAPQPLDLVALAENIVQEYQAVHPEMQVRGPDELVVQADPGRVAQAIGNLVNNAVQHSPDGTPVTVDLTTRRHDDGDWVVVSVQDQGSGIDPEVVPRLFTRFGSSHDSGGLGLGLYLARSIAEAHGGTVEVHSELGAGTSFDLTLPIVHHRTIRPGTGLA